MLHKRPSRALASGLRSLVKRPGFAHDRILVVSWGDMRILRTGWFEDVVYGACPHTPHSFSENP